MWGVLTMDGPHWVCHSPRWHILPGSELLRLPGALQGHFAVLALHFVHFPGLSHSGSQMLCRDTDRDWLCILCPSQLCTVQGPGAWRAHCPRWAMHLIHLPGPGHSVSWVCHESTTSVLVYVSSGELISGCDTPGRCQPSRIPGRRG